MATTIKLFKLFQCKLVHIAVIQRSIAVASFREKAPIRSGPTMMGDYSEVFAAFKGRGGAIPASTSNWSVYNVFKWVNIRVS
jgi:hypothetical protein